MSAPTVRLAATPPHAPTPEEGASTGRRIAAQLADTAPAPADITADALARAGIPRLRQLGIDVELVRSRPGCLVVRSCAQPPGDPEWACAVVSGWLDALPSVTDNATASVIEPSCALRGASSCIHTVMWTPRAPRRAEAHRLPDASPSTTRTPLSTVPGPTSPHGTGATVAAQRPSAEPPSWTPVPAPAHSAPAATPSPPASAPSPAPAEPRAPTTTLRTIPTPRPPAALAAPLAATSPTRLLGPPATFRNAPVSAPPAAPSPGPAPAPSHAPAGPPSPAPGSAAPSTPADVSVPAAAPTQGAPFPSTLREPPARGEAERAHPAPEPPGDPVRAPRGARAATAPTSDTATEDAPPASRATRRWPWLRRRAWLLVIGLLAGSLGGAVAAKHGTVSYSATAVLEVTGPSATSATSSAQGAAELAVTYSALIPSDEALLGHLATELHSTPAALEHQLNVQAEAGTALITVHFSGSSAAAAITGANDVARALSSTALPGRAVAPGSVTVVSSASAAARAGTLHKYGIPLGVILGLAVGLGAVVVAERTDRRVDDIETLAQAAECRATSLHGGLSTAELARTLERRGNDPLTIVPFGAPQRDAATALATALAAQGPGDAVHVASTGEVVGTAEGPTVLVVGPGERASAVKETADRLRLVGHAPAIAVLAVPPSAAQRVLDRLTASPL